MSRAAVLLPVAREVLARHDAVVHLQRLLEAGLSRNDVSHLLHLGVLARPRKGWYADPALSDPALRAIRVGGVLGCVSAAVAHGIVVPEQAHRHLHVSLVPGVSRLRRSDTGVPAAAGADPAVIWHWERRARPAAGWTVAPLDALLQMASCVEPRWLVAAIDSARCAAQRAPLLGATDIAELRDRLPEHLHGAVDRSDPRSETSGETFVRLGLEDRRIPFEPQVPLTSGYRADGTVGGWLPIEIDGLATHADREAVRRDRERDATIAQFGTPPLRFTESQAVRETAWVCDVIEAVWRRGRASTSSISRTGAARRA